MFMSSLEDNQNLSTTIRSEFEAMLISKDKIIKELQDKMSESKQLKRDLSDMVQNLDKDNRELKISLEKTTAQYKNEIINLNKMIEDKNNLNKALTDSCNDLKNKVNDMEKSLEDYENVLEKLSTLEEDYKNILAQNKSYISQISLIEKQKEEDLSDSDLEAIIRFLKIFYIVGGMPEAVKTWLDEKDLDKVEAVKKKILDSYMEDFDNIESANVRGKVIEVWNSLTNQLEDENKKFQYGQVKITARAREYEVGVEWLEKRGYVNKLFKIKSDKTSVKNEVDSKSFELFLTDVGLLTSMYGITYDDLNKDKSSILIKNSAIIEQFVHQELIYNKNIGQIFYWTSEATARIPFVFEDSGQIIPIDINVTGSTKAQSLKVYRQRYKNPMSVTITYEKFSMNDGLLNIPVYSVWNL